MGGNLIQRGEQVGKGTSARWRRLGGDFRLNCND
jgi:hypothetical protein